MDQDREKREQNGQLFLRFFSSTRLAVILIVVLVLASILGTVTPLLPGGLQDYHVYTSWWFVSLLLLLMVNIIICSWTKFPAIRVAARHQTGPFETAFVHRLKLCRHYHFPMEDEKIVPLLSEIMRAKGYHLEHVCAPSDHGSGRQLFRSEKGNLSRFSFYVTHLSLLIIAIGVLIGHIWGFKGVMQLSVGQASDLVYDQRTGAECTMPFVVRCDDFRITYYPESDMIKDYLSDLTVLINDRVVRSQTIEVNHPLQLQHFKIYQHSYGQHAFDVQNDSFIVEIEDREKKIVLNRLHAKFGQKYSFDPAHPEVFFEIVDYQPDFILGVNGQAGSRSQSMNNPAARVRISQESEDLDIFWVFAKFPDLDMGRHNTRYKISIFFPSGGFYTGLQVSKDPGVPFIWVGGILLSLGIFLAFFLSHRRYFFILEKTEIRGHSKTRMTLAAKTNANQLALEQEFESIDRKVIECGGERVE
ncbi:cytochrome c biogenesis protein ResB [bacterium]|nr:cytochrome c biogenesis protein ResB [bacterium]